MSKKSSTQEPKTTTLSINGTPKATISDSSASYQMNPYEQMAYDYAQKAIAEYLPQLNVFTPETQDLFNSQVRAYKNKSLNTLKNVYEPMVSDLKDDISSRFGNLNNSIFMNNLKEIEESKASATAELANNVQLKYQELVENEINKRLNYLTLLDNYQNQINNNALSLLKQGQSGLNSANENANEQARISSNLFNTLKNFISI